LRAALEKRTRDRVPLDWAYTMGNDGAALILIAERLSDPTRAQAAVREIEMALAVMQDPGNASTAAYNKA
jgi:hypothetical protein